MAKNDLMPRGALFARIKNLLDQARAHIVRNVNTTMTLTYFHVGRMIVEDEQQGKGRAGYAEKTIKSLSRQLQSEFGKGFSVINLQNMRLFYLVYGKYQTASVTSQKKTDSVC